MDPFADHLFEEHLQAINDRLTDKDGNGPSEEEKLAIRHHEDMHRRFMMSRRAVGKQEIMWNMVRDVPPTSIPNE